MGYFHIQMASCDCNDCNYHGLALRILNGSQITFDVLKVHSHQLLDFFQGPAYGILLFLFRSSGDTKNFVLKLLLRKRVRIRLMFPLRQGNKYHTSGQ
jgi:hypothetical protein